MERKDHIIVIWKKAAVIGAAAQSFWAAKHHPEGRGAQAKNLAESLVVRIILEYRKLIFLLVASSTLFAQGNGLTIKSQSPPIGPDVRQIVASSAAATLRSWQERLRYTYVERDEDGAWTRKGM